MKLGVVNFLPIAYKVEECTIDDETYKNGDMCFFEQNGRVCMDLNMEKMKYQLFDNSLEDLISKINDHIDFGLIEATDGNSN
jgi:hypothetical protein